VLAGALHPERQGALRASLAAEYPGLPPLRQVLTGTTGITATDLGDYVANLPAGTALGRLAGGPGAWSTEVQSLVQLLHGVDLLIWQNTAIMKRNPRGKQPEKMQFPLPAGQEREAETLLDMKRERRAARQAARKIRTNE
jgi:hypothetical protein